MTRPLDLPHRVTWEDEPTRSREVVALCQRCYPDGTAETVWLVSGRGVAHQALDDGTTACGIDARGESWWWRS